MLDDAKIQSFVGKNSGYYRTKWRRFHDKPGSIASFNAAACFGQVVWLAYRRLYAPLLWLIVVGFADVSVVLYVEENQLVSANLITAWNLFAGILYLAVPGFLGNYWYWGRFRKVEQQADSEKLDRSAQVQFIRSKGGTNPLGAWLVIVLMLMPVAWAVYQANRVDYSGFNFDATGPLTLAEIQANFLALMEEPLKGEQRECVLRVVEERARAAGDPETLDPTTVEFLPAEQWNQLDRFGRRMILAQAIITGAFFVCAELMS